MPIEDVFDRSRDVRRREVRGQLAEITIRRRRADELTRTLAEIDARLDRATDSHTSTCQPLQARLAELESRIVEALTNREPAPEDAERERVGLLAEIASANELLERESVVQGQLRKPLARERQQILMGCNAEPALKNKLAQDELGNPEMLDELFVAKQTVAWAESRLRAASEKLKAATEMLDVSQREKQTGGIEIAERRARRWRLESETAAKQQSEAMRECDRLHRAMVEE